MKYDSGMTWFHKDILASIRYMLKDDTEITEITEKFKAEDGPPTPLREYREYLKAAYGKPCRSHCGNGVHYVCYPTKGIGIMFDRILNNLGDTELTLSWSQVAKFIRDNWEEIFNNVKPISDSEEKGNMSEESYREALKKEFPQLTDEMINRYTRYTYCPGHFFDGDSVPFAATCNYVDDESLCSACWNKPCEGTYNGDPFDPSDWEDNPLENIAVASAGKSDEVNVNAADADVKEVSAVFDYSVLDNDTATALRSCEQSIRQETINYFTILGEKLKEAQSLLASHAKGTFESWYSSLGLKRQTVYNLIQRFDFLSSPTVGGREDVFECLPLTLSYKVSKPNAPQELVEKVLDGDITSNAEYQKMKAELDEAVKRAELAELHEKNAHEGFKHVEEASHKNFAKYQEEHKKVRQLEDKIYELEKEAKSRPIEVSVQPDETALAKKDEEIAELKEQLERSSQPGYKRFFLKITLEEYDELIKLTEGEDVSFGLHTAIKNMRLFNM